jgi:PAS domain S-box-containing protein
VISVLDGDGTIRYQNHVMCRLLNYEVDETVGWPLTQLLHPHSKKVARVSIDRMARQQATFDAWTLRFRTASEKTIWLEGLASNFLKDPRLGGIMVYWRRMNL